MLRYSWNTAKNNIGLPEYHKKDEELSIDYFPWKLYYFMMCYFWILYLQYPCRREIIL